METALKIIGIYFSVISFCFIYKYFYLVIGFFGRARQYKETENLHKYGIVICARNEEKVIGNLLDSIAAQNYPKEKLTVFVIADNCDDGTASIAKEKGAVVFERHDPEHARKGWALEYGFSKIGEEYGIENFDGFMFFDADNLLHPDFVHEMNKAFDSGKWDVITGYRNTKNFSTNCISSGYGIHFYYSTVGYHRPRNMLGTSTHLAGTGHVVKSSLLADGWKWHCLTEDAQFTLHTVSKGGKIGYCEKAEFFDEQPTRIRTMIRQRIRWIRGRLYTFFAGIPKMFSGIFKKNTNKWSLYDIFFYNYPRGLMSALRSVAEFLMKTIAAIVAGSALASATSGGGEPYQFCIRR